MAGISLSGLASGIDTDSVVEQLLALQRQPRARFQLREKVAEARESALRDVLSRVRTLRSAAYDLGSPGVWGDTQEVSSSDPGRIGAKRLAGAGPGGYQVEVTALARAAQRTYTWADPGADTTIDLGGGVSVAVTAGTTASQAAELINSRSDSPVYAVVTATNRMVLAARSSGAASDFTATSSALTEDGAAAVAGQDAAFTIDGVAHTSASNTVATALPGVELTLKALTVAGSPVSVSVGTPATDPEAVKAKVKAFVEQYNSTLDFIRSKLTEKKVPDARTEADALKGVLFGDTALTGILNSLRSMLGEQLGDIGNPTTLDQLSEIGVSTGAATGGASSADALAGKLVLDEKKFADALASNRLDVRRLLGGVSGTDGFAQKLDDLLEPLTRTDGLLQNRISSADGQAQRMRDAMARLDDRLKRQEDRLRTQFAALESAMSRGQAQQSWLTGQLAALAN